MSASYPSFFFSTSQSRPGEATQPARFFAESLAAERRHGGYCDMIDVSAFLNERFRTMSADEKVRLAHALWIETRNVTLAGVRARHPEWSDQQVAARVRELMRDAGP
jgi:hypothetical protein